jgi:hypothetical protein
MIENYSYVCMHKIQNLGFFMLLCENIQKGEEW